MKDIEKVIEWLREWERVTDNQIIGPRSAADAIEAEFLDDPEEDDDG